MKPLRRPVAAAGLADGALPSRLPDVLRGGRVAVGGVGAGTILALTCSGLIAGAPALLFPAHHAATEPVVDPPPSPSPAAARGRRVALPSLDAERVLLRLAPAAVDRRVRVVAPPAPRGRVQPQTRGVAPGRAPGGGTGPSPPAVVAPQAGPPHPEPAASPAPSAPMPTPAVAVPTVSAPTVPLPQAPPLPVVSAPPVALPSPDAAQAVVDGVAKEALAP